MCNVFICVLCPLIFRLLFSVYSNFSMTSHWIRGGYPARTDVLYRLIPLRRWKGTWGICDNNNNNDPDKGICTRRAGKLYKARSRLNRSQILQVNTRWKALAEIYTMHSFAPFCTVLNAQNFVKNR